MERRHAQCMEQLGLPFRKLGRGGARKNAGRKRNPDSGVPHRARPEHNRRHPVHVTLRVALGVPNLRTQVCFNAVRRAFKAGKGGGSFRVVHFTVQSNHLHLLVEADDKRALSRGLRALAIRIARALNRELRRKGRVFAERYHARDLQSPREVRICVAYVLLNNHRHAGVGARGREARVVLDPCSSAATFDGWRPDVRVVAKQPFCEPIDEMILPARTWLLSTGWQKAGGPLDPRIVPGPS